MINAMYLKQNIIEKIKNRSSYTTKNYSRGEEIQKCFKILDLSLKFQDFLSCSSSITSQQKSWSRSNNARLRYDDLNTKALLSMKIQKQKKQLNVADGKELIFINEISRSHASGN